MLVIQRKSTVTRRTPSGWWSVRVSARVGDERVSFSGLFRKEREARAFAAQRGRSFARIARLIVGGEL